MTTVKQKAEKIIEWAAIFKWSGKNIVWEPLIEHILITVHSM